MLILTVTLNPAVDKTIQVDDFTMNQVNRVREARSDAGGKGINVSHAIKAMGHESTSYAIIGGRMGKYIKNTMDAEGIAFKYLEVDQETRTNLKVVDPVNGTHTDINEAGPEVDADFEQKVVELIAGDIKSGDILVLSGSILPGMSLSLYPDLIRVAVSAGAVVIFDADGSQLNEGLNASPNIIKPNIDELSRLTGKTFGSDSEVIEYIRSLIQNGKLKDGALVSMGEAGALWVTEKTAIRVKAIKTEVKSTVGAGDSMVAALAIALESGLSEAAMLKLATAAAVARISTEGPIQCSAEKIDEISKRVVIETL